MIVSFKNYSHVIFIYNIYKSTNLKKENIKWSKNILFSESDSTFNQRNKVNLFTCIGSGTTFFNKGLYYEGSSYFVNSGWNFLSSVTIGYRKWSLCGIYYYTNYVLNVKDTNKKENIYKHSFLISIDYNLFALFYRKLNFKIGLFIPVYDIYTNKEINNYEAIKTRTNLSFLCNINFQINDKWSINLNYFKNSFFHFKVPLTAGDYKIHLHLINLGLSYKIK